MAINLRTAVSSEENWKIERENASQCKCGKIGEVQAC